MFEHKGLWMPLSGIFIQDRNVLKKAVAGGGGLQQKLTVRYFL